LYNAIRLGGYDDPDLIINFDETSIGAKEKKTNPKVWIDLSIGPCPPRKKQEKKEHITLCCGVSASGKRLPPIFMLKNQSAAAEAALVGPEYDFGPYGLQHSAKAYQTAVSFLSLYCTRSLNIRFVIIY
jgi:hypothetical protein